jgi:hypothetical protein
LIQERNIFLLRIRYQRYYLQRIAGRELVAVISIKYALLRADYQAVHRSRFTEIKPQIQLRGAGHTRNHIQLSAGAFQLGLQPQLFDVKINLSVLARTG